MKILGEGDLSKKLTVRVHRASRSAQEKIEGAGGTVELLVETAKVKPNRSRPRPRRRPREEKAAAEEEPAPAGAGRRAGAGRAAAGRGAEQTPDESSDAEEQPSEEE